MPPLSLLSLLILTLKCTALFLLFLDGWPLKSTPYVKSLGTKRSSRYCSALLAINWVQKFALCLWQRPVSQLSALSVLSWVSLSKAGRFSLFFCLFKLLSRLKSNNSTARRWYTVRQLAECVIYTGIRVIGSVMTSYFCAMQSTSLLCQNKEISCSIRHSLGLLQSFMRSQTKPVWHKLDSRFESFNRA